MKFFILLVLSLALLDISNAIPTPGDNWSPFPWNPASQELVDVLNYGVNAAVPDAIAEGELADGQWKWTNVTNLEIQVLDEGTYFEYYVDIENTNGDIAHLVMIVFEYSDGTTMKLTTFEIM